MEKGYYEDLEDNIKINIGERRLGCGHQYDIVSWECVNELSFKCWELLRWLRKR
jgi:hypothetical protein